MAQELSGVISRPPDANVGFLLIHGFCAAPDELASVSEFLERNRIASFAIQVKGHATTPEDLAKTSRQEWLESVSQGLDEVKSWNLDHLFVLGFSMGGALAIQLAAQQREIDAIILISPAIKIDGIASKLLPILKHVMKYRDVDLDAIQKKYGYDLPRTKYNREPLSAIHEIVRLSKESRSKLPQVTIPVLIIQGTADQTIPPECGRIVYDQISSKIKEIHHIENGPHVIPCHPSRNIAYTHFMPFIEKINNTKR